jgi:hypothetical protein
MHLTRSFVALLALALPACTWVSEADVEARLPEVDDDGDGVPKRLDCNDADATINPDVTEVWYDGIDQNCNGGDDYDQDLDGFVKDEHAGLPTQGVEGTGVLPAGDCDDEAPRISPQQPDTWYDGVDQNCDGVDDYDQDADGYVADTYVGRSTLYADGTGALPGGDCDDLDGGVRPDAVDVWYDGLDTNCDQADDYDQDADGYVPTELYADYAAGGGLLPNGDCVDTDAEIHPNAADAWYDGVDSDCVGDNDYDRDGDGYVPDAYSAFGYPGGDCDDTAAGVYTGAPEALGDSVDADCVGGPDDVHVDASARLTTEGVHSPTFAAASAGIYLTIGASRVATDAATYYDSAVAEVWLPGDLSDGSDGTLAWFSSTTDPTTYSLSAALDVTADDDYVWGAAALTYPSGLRGIRLVRYDFDSGARIGPTATSTAPSVDCSNGLDDDGDGFVDGADPECASGDSESGGRAVFHDVSVVRDGDGLVHAVGCEATEGALNYVQWNGGDPVADVNVEVAGAFADRCLIGLSGGVPAIWTSEAGSIVRYDFDATSSEPTFTASTAYAGVDAADMELREDRLIVADAAADELLVIEADGSTEAIASSAEPVAVDAMVAADGTVFVIWADADGGAWLARGDATSGYTRSELLSDVGAVRDVAVYARGGAVLVVLTGDAAVATEGVAY